MPDLSSSPSLAKMFAEIDRRLRTLETAPQLRSSSIRGGGLNVYDDSNVLAARLGQTGSYPAPDEAGAVFYSASGEPLLSIGRFGDDGAFVDLRAVAQDEGFGSGWGARFGRWGNIIDPLGGYATGVTVQELLGAPILQASAEYATLWERPLIGLPVRKADDAYSTTSGTFVPTWRADTVNHLARFCYVQVVVSADASTAGEVQVVNGTHTAATQTIPSGSTGTTLTWKWDLAGGGSLASHAFVVNARRTSGAGSVRVYAPIIQLGRPDGSVTTTGI